MTTPAAQAWERFARKATPRRAVNAAGARTWLNWTQYPDHGPDESVLGPISGKRVAELGSGTGANLAHLATLGAHCLGIDIAPTRIATATGNWAHLPNIEFVSADVVDHLAMTGTTYDIVYSIFGAIWFTDPAILLPLIRDALTPNGVVVFSHLPADDAPSRAEGLIARYDLPLPRWEALLHANGFTNVTSQIIAPPAGEERGTLLVRAIRS